MKLNSYEPAITTELLENITVYVFDIKVTSCI